MSHSYDYSYQTKDKWEKLIIYLYSRILSGGAEVNMDIDWSTIIHNEGYLLDVTIDGDTEGYENLCLRCRDRKMIISNRTWFSHKCFTNLLKHAMEKYTKSGKGP